MRKIKNLIKLTSLNAEGLNGREQNVVSGGSFSCGCWYSQCGGSSEGGNLNANGQANLHSLKPEGQAEWNFA